MQLYDLPGDPSRELLLCKTFFRLNHRFVFCLVPKIFLLVSTWTLPSAMSPYYSCPELFIYCYFIHMYLATIIYFSFSQEISNNCGVVFLLNMHEGEQQLEATI